MKHILAMFLACILLFSAAGCAIRNDSETAESSESAPLTVSEPNETSAENIEVQVENMTMHPGDRYYGTFSTDVNGEALFSVSREGIVEIISAEWTANKLYYLDFQAIAPGEVTLTVCVGGYSYRIVVTVEKDPAVCVTDGELDLDIAVDKTDGTVYVDDTTVTYTVVTAPTVDSLGFEQLGSVSPMYSYNSVISGEVNAFAIAEFTVDDSTLTDTKKTVDGQIKYAAKKEFRDDKLYWTVELDFGYTAVSILRIRARDTASGLEHTGYVHLNIGYPVFDPSEGLENIALFWLALNMDEPLLFTVDTQKLTQRQQDISDQYDKAAIFESEVYMMSGFQGSRDYIDGIYYLQSELTNREYYDLMFDSSPLYHMNTLGSFSEYGLVSVAMCNDPNNAEIYPQFLGKNRLVSNYWMENATYIFYGDISAEIRAVMAYRNDFEIDETIFPYAYAILQRGSQVISEIIHDGMSDFEKEKAIYDWMITNYNSGLTDGSALPSEEERYYAVKTAYGLLNGYHGDCTGWSGTFFTLCNMAGLDCATVDVAAKAGGPVEYSDNYEVNHRINLIRLDGEYYFTEVYWFYQKHSPEDGDYRYMNMTTETAAEYYTWLNEEAFGPVVCSGTTYLVNADTGELLKG